MSYEMYGKTWRTLIRELEYLYTLVRRKNGCIVLSRGKKIAEIIYDHDGIYIMPSWDCPWIELEGILEATKNALEQTVEYPWRWELEFHRDGYFIITIYYSK